MTNDTLVFNSIATSTSRVVQYTIELCEASPIECIKYENRSIFSKLCKDGCKNYDRKWCCPPHSPGFSTLAQPWEKLYVVFLHIPMDGFSDVKNSYLRVKAANSMLKSRADKFVRIVSKNNGRAISTGSCRLCKPCHFQKGEPCAHPRLMAYSFEALGINVNAMVTDLFTVPLQWYKTGVMPEYTSVVCGVLTNSSFSLDDLHDIYLKNIL